MLDHTAFSMSSADSRGGFPNAEVVRSVAVVVRAVNNAQVASSFELTH